MSTEAWSSVSPVARVHYQASAFFVSLCFSLSAADATDPLVSAWREWVQVRDIVPAASEHVIHAYFNTCPESPDGRWVLFYASSSADADQGGELRVLERATGNVRTLARVARIEDAHRVACQQWVDGGRAVVFHDLREGHWQVLAVDTAQGGERVLAVDRQLGFGSSRSPNVPLYGCHWNPGPHRNLELVDVRTGKVSVAVKIDDAIAPNRAWAKKTFATADGLSVFFPVMSPDGKKVFFKVAKGRGGDDFRGMDASLREGKLVWDLDAGEFLRRFDLWGHPSWAPGSDGIFEKGNVLTRLDDGSNRQFAKGSPSNHPSLAPDAGLFVTDADISKRVNVPGTWGIIVGSTTQADYAVIHQFDNRGGARSWRCSHPHPIFSADGQRIYFNVSSGPWTRLMVAEKQR